MSDSLGAELACPAAAACCDALMRCGCAIQQEHFQPAHPGTACFPAPHPAALPCAPQAWSISAWRPRPAVWYLKRLTMHPWSWSLATSPACWQPLLACQADSGTSLLACDLTQR